jgi:hypothetical protein
MALNNTLYLTYPTTFLNMISGFHCEVHENCILLGYYAASIIRQKSVVLTFLNFITFPQEDYKVWKHGWENPVLVYDCSQSCKVTPTRSASF